MTFLPSLAYLISLGCSQMAALSFESEKKVHFYYRLGVVFLLLGLVLPAQAITIALASLVACLSLEYFVPSVHYGKIKQENIKALQYFIISNLILHLYYKVHPVIEAAWGFKGNIVLMGLIGVVVLDFKNYWIHRMQHKFAWWWNLHFVHHDQTELMTFSSAPVFLPEWILLRLVLSSTIVYVLGFPFYTMVLYSYFAVISGIWSHANFRVAPGLSRTLEWLVVTPDYHRQHHISGGEHERSNYADIFTIWDRLFGTYRKPIEINGSSFSNNEAPRYKSILKEQLAVAKAFFKSY